MAARHSKFHDVSPRDYLDRFAFLIAFAVGVVGSIALKLMGMHPFIAAAFAGLILVAYAVVSWAGGRIRIEPEAIGDNCYYLGFLFTLASLAFTLYQIADPTSNGGKPINIPDVISGFGVALSSTIIGVFLRVFMMQMRPDFVAKDRAVRAELNQSYSKFRKNLSGTLSQMKAFSTESIQFAAERDKQLRDATEKFVKDHQDALVRAADVLAKNMEKSFSDTAETLAENMEEKFAEAAQKAVEDISASVKSSSLEAQEALKVLVTDIQAMKNRLGEQESQAFEDISNRRRRLAAELENTEKQAKAHDLAMVGFIKVTRQAADTMTKQIVPALNEFQKRLDALPRTENADDRDPVASILYDGVAVDAPFESGDAGRSSQSGSLDSTVDEGISVTVKPQRVTPRRVWPWGTGKADS